MKSQHCPDCGREGRRMNVGSDWWSCPSDTCQRAAFPTSRRTA